MLRARQNVAVGHDTVLIGWAASIAPEGADHGDGVVVVVELPDVVDVVVVVLGAARGALGPHPAATVNTTITARDDDGRRRKIVVGDTRRHSSMAVAGPRAGAGLVPGRITGHFEHFCDNGIAGAGETRMAGARRPVFCVVHALGNRRISAYHLGMLVGASSETEASSMYGAR
ncbi:MAG TPA: hypothetical protein VID75_13065 [Acidimicrobiales bacterium]